MLRSLHIVLLATLVLAPARAFGEDFVEPTEAQRNYNDRGVQLMLDSEFEQAAANFRSSLSLGESNIAWLNYGRALFKLDRCAEARDAYREVGEAPAVKSPTPDEIATVLTRFQDEWEQACTARITLQCPDESVRVRIGGSDEFICHGDLIPVVPGRHPITTVSRSHDASPVLVVKVADGETLEVDLRGMEREDEPSGVVGEPGPDMPESDPAWSRPSEGPSAGRIVGYTLLGVGAAGLGAAVLLDRLWVAPAFDDYEASTTPSQWTERREVVRGRQTTNIVVMSAGGILAAAGLVAVIVSPAERSRASVTFTGTGLAVGMEW